MSMVFIIKRTCILEGYQYMSSQFFQALNFAKHCNNRHLVLYVDSICGCSKKELKNEMLKQLTSTLENKKSIIMVV